MKRFSEDFKTKLLQEVKDVGSVPPVAQKHGISAPTVYSWIKKSSKSTQTQEKAKAKDKRLKELEKKLSDQELEIQVLRELLKKTNHAWLGE